MKKEFQLKSDGSILTPEFRVSFPNVFQPHPDSGTYGVSMLFDKDVDFSLLEEEIENKIKDAWPKGKPKRDFTYPIHDGDDSTRAEHQDKFYINAKAGKYRPGLVDQNRAEIIDEAEFYPGCYARAVCTLYHWVYLGKCGISVNVRNIQKTRDGEPLIGRVMAEDEFEPVAETDVSDL